MSIDYDYLMKIIVVGDSQVGKSSLLIRYTEGSFYQNQTSTIGLDLKLRTEIIEGKTCRVQIWDTAGQERFRTITQTFYRATHGVLIVFDLTNEDSFRSVRKWYEEIKRYSTENTVITLVGNKNDQEEKRAVSYEDARALADDLKVDYIETSARSNDNVDKVFQEITHKVYRERVPIVESTKTQRVVKDPKPLIEKYNRQCPFWPF